MKEINVSKFTVYLNMTLVNILDKYLKLIALSLSVKFLKADLKACKARKNEFCINS